MLDQLVKLGKIRFALASQFVKLLLKVRILCPKVRSILRPIRLRRGFKSGKRGIEPFGQFSKISHVSPPVCVRLSSARGCLPLYARL